MLPARKQIQRHGRSKDYDHYYRYYDDILLAAEEKQGNANRLHLGYKKVSDFAVLMKTSCHTITRGGRSYFRRQNGLLTEYGYLTIPV